MFPFSLIRVFLDRRLVAVEASFWLEIIIVPPDS